MLYIPGVSFSPVSQWIFSRCNIYANNTYKCVMCIVTCFWSHPSKRAARAPPPLFKDVNVIAQFCAQWCWVQLHWRYGWRNHYFKTVLGLSVFLLIVENTSSFFQSACYSKENSQIKERVSDFAGKIIISFCKIRLAH